MATDHLLISLKEKHARLENEIEQQVHHPLPDQALINHMKKQKLALKDQIQSIEQVSICS